MSTAAPARLAFDVESVRRDFPILAGEARGRPLAYLDNAASSQRPVQVLDAIEDCYRRYYANVHRGVHHLSELSTRAYEEAREKLRGFLNAAESREIVFVRGTTEGINLVASSFGAMRVGAGDEVLISAMEHHSNIVPWQLLCERQGARLVIAPIDDDGQILVEEFERRLTERTRIVGVVHVSNALGTINPVRQLVDLAHARDIPVLVDGAQAAPHLPIDVQELGCDFYTLSGHKMFGPSGIGALYGRSELLASMPPYQGGGEMIRSVTFEKSEFAPVPHKFEAGTPNIAGAIGLGAAVDYLDAFDHGAMEAHEADLLAHATAGLLQIPGVRIIGTAAHKSALVGFVMEGAHPHDIGTILDAEGIAVRAGHHCAQPVMDRFGVPATVRASFAFYNTRAEVDRLLAAVQKVREVFSL